MAAADRPFSEVLNSIFGNVADIVRSELKLAKTEVREEVSRATYAAGWLATAVVSALFALGFVLVAVFFALLFVLPNWAAALLIAVVLGLVSTIGFQVYDTKRKALLGEKRVPRAQTLHKENLA